MKRAKNQLWIAKGVFLMAGALLFSSACRKTTEWIPFWPDSPSAEEQEAADTEITVPDDRTPESADGGAPAETLPAEDILHIDPETGGHMETAPAGGSLPEGQPVEGLEMIYFGFDEYDLTEESLAVLEANAEFLKRHPGYKVILRGHTDDQGTEEYNLALGQKRARAARETLIELGIEPSRLQTVSFGEAVPLEEGEDDAAAARNRRVEFFVYE